MKKKQILILLVIFSIFFINLSIVSAVDYNGSGSSTSGGGATSSGSWGLGKGATGIKITLTDGKRTNDSNEICSFNITRTELENYYNFDNINSWWTSSNTVNSTYLYSYLDIPYVNNDGDYNTLIWFIKNYSVCSSKTINNNTFIYIEPFATKSHKIYTLHELLISGIDTNDGAAARILANAASTGSKGDKVFGVYNSVSTSCDKSSWTGGKYCGVKSYGGNGYGVVEIQATEIPGFVPDPVVPDPDPTKIVITKLDTDGNPISGVTFTLTYKKDGTKQTATTNNQGIVVFSNLTPDSSNDKNNPIYILTETVPSGYSPSKSILYYTDYNGGSRVPDAPGTNTATWNIYEVKTNRILTITNEKTCVSEFSALSDKNNLKERIRLYNTYKSTSGQKLNNLLNLNIIDASTACSYKTCSNSLSPGCLAVSNSSTADNDFSCYDFTLPSSIGNFQIYCFSNFELKNLFSGSPSNGNYQFGQNYNIFSGQLITQIQNGNAAQLNLNIVCYSPEDAGESLSLGTYSDYISKIVFKDQELGYSNKNSTINSTSKVSKYGGYIYFSFTNSTYFTLPKVYSHILDGKIEYNITEDLSNYRDLGYGIISQLDDYVSSNQLLPIKYSITFGSKIIDSLNIRSTNSGVYSNSTACAYTVKNKIIETPSDPQDSDDLNLEFRIIDTTNPFPGKSGTVRTVGDNWCEKDSDGNIVSCNGSKEENSLVESVMNNNNSYNQIGEGAKYTIRLTASDIKQIRKYNNEEIDGVKRQYSDYSITCETKNGEEVCTSSVIESMKNGTIGNYSLSNKLAVK